MKGLFAYCFIHEGLTYVTGIVNYPTNISETVDIACQTIVNEF